MNNILKLSQMLNINVEFGIKGNLHTCIIILKVKNKETVDIDFTPISIVTTKEKLFQEMDQALEQVYNQAFTPLTEINNLATLLENAKKTLEEKANIKKKVKIKKEEIAKNTSSLFDVKEPVLEIKKDIIIQDTKEEVEEPVQVSKEAVIECSPCNPELEEDDWATGMQDLTNPMFKSL